MLPRFPNFKKLEFTDRLEIEAITKQFPPYSDFNFISLWSWDVDNSTEVSTLNGALIIKLKDYLNDFQVYSFLGNISELFFKEIINQINKKGDQKIKIKLLPELSIENLSSSFQEDRDNFDYILDTRLLSEYPGSKFSSKRNYVKKFKEKYQASDIMIDFNDIAAKKVIHECLEQWVQKKKEADKFFEQNELRAIEKLINSPSLESMKIFAHYISDYLAGFELIEILDKENAILHFEKKDTNYKGISAYAMQEVGKMLINKGIVYLNIEQDLGLPGLREAKEGFRPIKYLKKYSI